MKKNKIVLYCACDRYNYGDNLMPIVFDRFVDRFRQDIIEKYEIVCCAISASDLSNYGAPKTLAMNEVYYKLTAGDAVIVAGGEVLCSRNSTLFLHMPRAKLLNDILHYVNKVPLLNKVLEFVARKYYPIPWSYPYIPSPKMIANGVNLIYNTVGGQLNLGVRDLNEVVTRMNAAAHISVRDTRTLRNLKALDNVKLAPDSVHIMSLLFDEEFFVKNAKKTNKKYHGKFYFCFQAAPRKVGESFQLLVDSLKEICKMNACKVLLLPIGYASGHDDILLSRRLHEALGGCSILEDDLTLWDIMDLIRNSQLYIGTSLHGAITALSYSVPHFGLNKEIVKLNDFLGDWSVAPYNQSYFMKDIVSMSSDFKSLPRGPLRLKSVSNNKNVVNNFNEILDLLLR